MGKYKLKVLLFVVKLLQENKSVVFLLQRYLQLCINVLYKSNNVRYYHDVVLTTYHMKYSCLYKIVINKRLPITTSLSWTLSFNVVLTQFSCVLIKLFTLHL